MKKSTWLPALLFLAGAAVYIYDGIEYNSWMHNLPNMGVFTVIVAGLIWSLRKKQKLAHKRESEDKETT